MGSSGSTSTPVQTTQQSAPWTGVQPYLSQAYALGLGDLNADIGYQPWTGSTQAALHPYQTQGLENVASTAMAQMGGGGGMQAVKAAQDLGANVIGNEGLTQNLQSTAGKLGDIYSTATGDQNPYLQDVINQQMSKVNSAMSGAGRYGSGAHEAAVAQAIAPTLASDYQNRQQMRLQSAGALGDLYNTGLSTAGKFAQIAPSMMEASYLPAQHLADVGQFYTNYQQKALDDQIKMYNAQQARPWEQLQRFNALLSGAGSLGGTQVTTSPGPTTPSFLQRGLGGVLAGASLGSIFPGVGTGIGAAAGGLLGLL